MRALRWNMGRRAGLCLSVILCCACGGDDDAGNEPSAGSGGMAGTGLAGAMAAGSGGTGVAGAGGMGGAGGTGGSDAGTDPDASSMPDSGDPCAAVANACATAGTRCDNATLVTCAANSNDCLVETRTDCTQGSTHFCDADASPPACAVDPCAGVANRCNEAGTSCDGNVLVTCAADGDGCLVRSQTTCTAAETCGDGDDPCNRCDGTLEDPACAYDPCFTAAGQPKQSVCVVNETTCAEDILITCVDDDEGCPIATPTDCETAQICGAESDEPCNICDGSAEPPSCVFDPCKDVTDCLAEGITCRGTTLVECERTQDDCLVETLTDCTQGGTVSETCDPSGDTPVCAVCMPAPGCETADEGDQSCNENALETCTDLDGDNCLDRAVEVCGADFTCGTQGCTYSGAQVCVPEGDGGACCPEMVLRESGSFGPFSTVGASNDYSSYVCPGLNPSYPFLAAAPDLLFALDVAAGTAAQVTITGVMGFSGTNPPNLMLLTNCADGDTEAEASCQQISRSSVGFANEGATTRRVYVVVDADVSSTTGSFGLEVLTHPIICGDAIRDGSEECDDGNIFSGDGCTPECTLEDGYSCTSTNPSVCTLRPENGVCGNVQCDPLPSNAPSGTQMCCTTAQTCGVAYPYLFGAGCMERSQPGVNGNGCRNEIGRFFFWPPTLSGCCRPDNRCGLTAAVGAGCVERTEVWRNMEDGNGAFLYAGPFQAISCTHP
jgi:cysteine-rich repeat protein